MNEEMKRKREVDDRGHLVNQGVQRIIKDDVMAAMMKMESGKADVMTNIACSSCSGV